jgi:PAS domain S-box-containing protein
MTLQHQRATSALTDLLFDEPGLGRCLVAPDGCVLRANAEWLRSTGLALDDVLGADVIALLPQKRELALALHARVRAGHRVEVPPHAVRHCGRETWWQGSIAPVPMEGRTGLLITTREIDITDLERAEAAQREAVARYERQVRLFEGVASTTPDFVYLFDLQGRFLYANRRLLEVWGLELRDAVGKTCRELGYEQWHHDLHMREIGEVIATGRPIKGEVPFKAPRTGTFGVYEYIFTPVIGPDGAVETIAGTTRDVTERKRGEDALREADRRKDQFLAVLSHELRNPLAPIRSGIHVIERAPPGSDAAARALDIVRRQADHLARLVDDLLDITRIAHDKIELQLARIDARDVVRRAWENARALFEERHVELLLAQADEPIWVDADAARLSQLVGNLLHNALKFTPPRGQVRVGVERRSGACHLSVSDTGLGIEAADLERIFEEFVQLDRTRHGQGGMGLGLALVRELAGRMGGTVRAASAGPGQGAEFVVSLPLRSPPPRAAAPAASDRSVTGLSILVVEDNEDAAATLADLLDLDGHDVVTAGTGRAGIDAVLARPPDVLICDVGLPDLSGHGVIREVRARLPLGGVFAIALTGYAQPQDREAALSAGFDAHLPKPPPLDALDALLREAARRKELPAAGRE